MRRLFWVRVLGVMCSGVGVALSCGGVDPGGAGAHATTTGDAGHGGSTGSLIDHGDGTATDPLTGLTWEVTPSSEHLSWDGAQAYCDALSLGGRDIWRVPTISQLRSLIRGCNSTMTDGVCGVTDGCFDNSCDSSECDGCDALAGPGPDGAYWPPKLGGVLYPYWSSTQCTNPGGLAWMVDFSLAGIRTGGVGMGATDKFVVRCVYTAEDDDPTFGIWTDPSSGLTWQLTPSGGSTMGGQATTYCDTSTVAGGGWRLPTISELRTLIRGCDGTMAGGACGVTDSCLLSSCEDASCSACVVGGGPSNGCYGPLELPGECDWYWSSSGLADDATSRWAVDFDGGFIDIGNLLDLSGGADYRARCVR
jgi:hypothetical protein